jgi:hypothetical protein
VCRRKRRGKGPPAKYDLFPVIVANWCRMTKADFLKEQARLEERRCILHPLLIIDCSVKAEAAKLKAAMKKTP